MQINDFDSFRAGNKWPGCLDIKKLGYHSEIGVMAEAVFIHGSSLYAKTFIQFRKHNKDPFVAIFSFNYEVELEEFWQDSTVIWDSRNVTNTTENHE